MNRRVTTGRRLKQRVHALLRSGDFERALDKISSWPEEPVINALMPALLSTEQEFKWRAVTALGIAVEKLARRDMERARIIMRRLMWLLNEESGSTGWGVPEAMAEIMASCQPVAEEYVHILLSYLKKGPNYLGNDVLIRGVIWGIGRVAQSAPHLAQAAGNDLRSCLRSTDPSLRGLAAWSCGLIGDRSYEKDLEALLTDEARINIYSNHRLISVQVRGLAREALERLALKEKAEPANSSKRRTLEALYARYNRRDFVHPDPLEFLYRYPEILDREIAGLIASSLAYGRVSQILKSVSVVLDRMGPSPYEYLCEVSADHLKKGFSDIRHRFSPGEEIAGLLWAIKSVIDEYGSLYGCFLHGFNQEGETLLPALLEFAEKLRRHAMIPPRSLLPSPSGGSAFKRLNLFLRWMVRKDEVDPGGWDGIDSSKLIIPLDTHMHRICRSLGFTRRNQANMAAALEITASFRLIVPEDPVRYDFALTRLGILEGGITKDFFLIGGGSVCSPV